MRECYKLKQVSKEWELGSRNQLTTKLKAQQILYTKREES